MSRSSVPSTIHGIWLSHFRASASGSWAIERASHSTVWIIVVLFLYLLPPRGGRGESIGGFSVPLWFSFLAFLSIQRLEHAATEGLEAVRIELSELHFAGVLFGSLAEGGKESERLRQAAADVV